MNSDFAEPVFMSRGKYEASCGKRKKKMNSFSYQKEIPVKYQVDVFVGGGGPAGVTAAVAAARAGSSVMIAENTGSFGGMGTVGLVPAYMQITDGVHLLCAGLGKEILDRLYGDKTGKYCKKMGIHKETLKRVYDEMITESGITYQLMTRIVDVRAENGRVEYVILAAKEGLYAVKAKMYIDCTGDGDLCVMAGAGYQEGDENGVTMPSTLCSYWTNIDWRQAEGINQSSYLEQAFKERLFEQEDRHLPGIWQVGEHEGGGNCGHAYDMDALNTTEVSKALVHQRRILPQYERYYQKYVPGFQNAALSGTADVLGVRASRRIEGDYVLSVEDYEKRAVFEDEIGRYAYPIDIHPPMGTDAFKRFSDEYNRRYRYDKGESYGIPYRSLVARNFDNLLVAGRCVSCDHYVQASIRVMPGCYILGQAAGTAAHLAAAEGCTARDIPVGELQKMLAENGAYLPNYRE